MAKIIKAPTLDDALTALGGQIARAEERGERTLVFCEDRLTLLAERAVLSACGGTFLTEVTTFARFLSGPKVLSKEGSVLVVSDLLSECEKELVCFRPRAAQAVYETLAQLAASRVDGETLRRSAEEVEGALRGKLADLALLLDRYKERLSAKGFLDENGYLALLPEKFSSAALFQTNVVFFGFRSFTKQALEGVRAALLSAKSVTGVFLAGNAEIYTNEAYGLFRRVCGETVGAEEISAEDTLGETPRRLRDGLFSPAGGEKFRTGQIRRFTAADEAEEFSLIAALIRKHVFEGTRYREIAVLVSDKESFQAVEKAFNAYKIPYFADQKRPFSEHPFCALVLDLLLAVSDGVLPDEADAVAANYYFGDGAQYRNYLLRYGGYRGGVRREIREETEGFDRAALLACRERMLAFLSCFPRKGKGKDFVAAISSLRALAEADERTQALSAFFTGAEREFLDLKPLGSVLAEIEAVAGERSFTAREFYDGLKNALSALEIAMIPQSLDAVFVGDVTESKFGRVRVLFASGMTEEIPRVCQDTAVISDGEMEGLSALKVEIEPAIAQVNARARESLALNLCAFTQTLYLSRPLQKGRENTEPSQILADVEQIFVLPPMPELFPFDCVEPLPARLRMLALKEGFEAGREEDVKKYSTLFTALGGTEEEREKRSPAAGALFFSSEISPSLLESYFECPYAGFARVLRLRERQERPILDTDAGTFVHAVLERTAKGFNNFAGEEECRSAARAIGEELLGAGFAALSDTAAGKYTGARLLEEAVTVAVAAYRQLAGSAFRVAETEGTVSLSDIFSGKADRVDTSGEFVRVVDYKTGKFDDSPTAFYTGRKLQLELYLRAAAAGGRAAGTFYFPASDPFTAEGEAKYRMSGFYCGEWEVLSRMDRSLKEGETSALFDYNGGGDRGMPREDFEAFLDYAVLVSLRAEHEMREGNIAPSPYEKACKFCKMKSLCGYVGSPRKESSLKCAEIVRIVRRERGEE